MARTGRPPASGTSRDGAVCVRFSVDERKAIDASRGGASRSDFVRDAVNAAVKRGRK